MNKLKFPKVGDLALLAYASRPKRDLSSDVTWLNTPVLSSSGDPAVSNIVVISALPGLGKTTTAGFLNGSTAYRWLDTDDLPGFTSGDSEAQKAETLYRYLSTLAKLRQASKPALLPLAKGKGFLRTPILGVLTNMEPSFRAFDWLRVDYPSTFDFIDFVVEPSEYVKKLRFWGGRGDLLSSYSDTQLTQWAQDRFEAVKGWTRVQPRPLVQSSLTAAAVTWATRNGKADFSPELIAAFLGHRA